MSRCRARRGQLTGRSSLRLPQLGLGAPPRGLLTPQLRLQRAQELRDLLLNGVFDLAPDGRLAGRPRARTPQGRRGRRLSVVAFVEKTEAAAILKAKPGRRGAGGGRPEGRRRTPGAAATSATRSACGEPAPTASTLRQRPRGREAMRGGPRWRTAGGAGAGPGSGSGPGRRHRGRAVERRQVGLRRRFGRQLRHDAWGEEFLAPSRPVVYPGVRLLRLALLRQALLPRMVRGREAVIHGAGKERRPAVARRAPPRSEGRGPSGGWAGR